jgi:hypothetical protein
VRAGWQPTPDEPVASPDRLVRWRGKADEFSALANQTILADNWTHEFLLQPIRRLHMLNVQVGEAASEDGAKG